jgi:cytoplasmic iron level regulating protein YaaA (DUF328/UPF0246 family)
LIDYACFNFSSENTRLQTALPTDTYTQPRLLAQSQQLIDVCRKLSATEIASLMTVSEKIANLNVERFRDWNADFDFSNARQALFAFKGDVYTGLDAYHLKDQDIDFAQQHLRMLSGLYGLLRPLDLMMPYRLEMGTKLKNSVVIIYMNFGAVLSPIKLTKI